MTGLWIAGGSGAALEVWAVARAMALESNPAWQLRGFLVFAGAIDFDPEGLEVREEADFLAAGDMADSLVVLAMGDPFIRSKVAARYAKAGARFATLVHPRAVIGPRCELGEGSVIMAQAVVETHVTIGSHALLNVGCSVAHNAALGEFCNLGPGVRLAGWVSLGNRCDLGVGSCVKPRIELGDDVRVGAGAAVVKSHTGPATLIGVPARPARSGIPLDARAS